MLFGDYLKQWLEGHKQNIEENTYFTYKNIIHKVIAPHFDKKNIMLDELTDRDIKEFYSERLETVKNNTVIRYHANIRKALDDAFINGLIPVNPAAKVKKPKAESFIGDYYNAAELQKLFELVKGKNNEFPVLMCAYYGLRRSEAVGLKWSAFDFYYNTLTIKHTVVKVSTGKGERKLIKKDRVKTKKSYRTLPLIPEIVKLLTKIKTEQEANKNYFGDKYNKKCTEYVCVDKLGNIMNPDNITKQFKLLIKGSDLKTIRLHDLRHSCATLLRRQGIPLEDIQHWLGHSSLTRLK